MEKGKGSEGDADKEDTQRSEVEVTRTSTTTRTATLKTGRRRHPEVGLDSATTILNSSLLTTRLLSAR